jgi:lactate racemase
MSVQIPNKSNCVRILEKDQKIFFHYGEGYHYEALPKGSRVVYPPPSVPGIVDVDGAIEQALNHPLGCDPLSAQLRPGMKVTIAFDDISLPLPPMTRPDIRERIITKVLEKLSDAGVTDIHLIAAIALHRRMTPDEMRHQLGDQIFDAFYPHQLYNYDAEDKDGNVFLGKTDKGEEVEVSRRAAESDLVIYVNINQSSMNGGNKSFSTGLSTYRTIRHSHNHHTLMRCASFMDTKSSALQHSFDRQGRVIEEHLNIFKIETTINGSCSPKLFSYTTKPIWSMNPLEKLGFRTNQFLSQDFSESEQSLNTKRKIFTDIKAPYQMTSIYAGKTEAFHDKIVDRIYQTSCVPVQGQSDILVIGIPYLSPYDVNSTMNPVLTYVMALGYMFNSYRGKPIVRKGGVMIAIHPFRERFHPIHHPSYIDFYHQVLKDTTDPKVIEEKYEEEFAYNPKYIELYRYSYAFHGVHPFYMWYWGSYALAHLGKVIFVNVKDPRPAEVMGFDTAKSVAEAIEKAKDVVGADPSITNFHLPPYMLLDVE